MNNRVFLYKSSQILLIIGILFFILGEKSVKAEEKEVDINTTTKPNGYFFEVGNLKPGDWMPRELTIMNEGKVDFKYTARIGEKKSVKGLLEELDLLVKKDEDVLYDGKLNEFTGFGFNPRNLTKGSSETLFFQVTMPPDLGNEFQDASAEVEIIFLAESITGDDNESPEEPPTDDNPPDEPPITEEPEEEDNTPEDPPSENESEDDNNTPENPPSTEDSKDEDHPTEEPPTEDEPVDEEPENNTNPPGEPTKKDEPEDKSDQPENPPIVDEPTESSDPKEDPNNPIDEETTITPKMTNKLLPDTATNTYNFMLVGGILLTLGCSLLVLYSVKIRRKH